MKRTAAKTQFVVQADSSPRYVKTCRLEGGTWVATFTSQRDEAHRYTLNTAQGVARVTRGRILRA